MSSHIKAFPIIFNHQHDLFIALANLERDVSSGSVFDHVVNEFLSDPVKGEFVGRLEAAVNSECGKLEAGLTCFIQLSDQPLDSHHISKFLKHRRAEICEQRSYISHSIGDEL